MVTLEGGISLGPAAWANPFAICPELSELHEAQAAVDRRLIAWCDGLDDLKTDRIIHVHRGYPECRLNGRTGYCCTCSSIRSTTAARLTAC